MRMVRGKGKGWRMGQQLGPFGFVINSRVLPLGKEGEGGKGGKIYLSIPHELIVFSLNFFSALLE